LAHRPFLSSIHPIRLIDAIDKTEAALKRHYRDVAEIPLERCLETLSDDLMNVGLEASEAGREYAESFRLGMEKRGWIDFGWNYQEDIRKIIEQARIKPSQWLQNEIHKAMETGEGPPVERLSRRLGYEQARNIARTAIMNIQAKSALRVWDQDGIKHVKRIAHEDLKTCGICRALNGKEYLVAELILMTDPQSHDTHFSCRCGLIPVIDISTYAPKRRVLPKLKITTKHNTAENVPIEIYSMLKSLMHGGALPFNIKFDKSIKADYKRQGGDLVINPKALVDEDLRELIYEEQAEEMWPQVEQRVIDEYLPLLQRGFAKTSRSWDTPKEAFTNNWIAFKLGQAPFDKDIWGQVFMRSLS